MMSSARTNSEVSPARWMWLVLAVVAGVLGMHSLSPAGMPATGQHALMAAQSTGHGHRPALAHTGGEDCRHLSDAGDGGMAMDHAGGTCAAGGTAAAYIPPALMPSPAAVQPAATAGGVPAAGAVDGRAPPDLSELQLLRI
ncbi:MULTISPECIES: DUF6153 family protein [unclassified Streptomyces]|uniref:DUF6153 family protein n=1 Tax=unclassified Streptomyces TaxID=2593676 RepID=UPI000B88E1FC|nr:MULTISPECIES: DUF6153 family protein [unclassified Streptomyces]